MKTISELVSEYEAKMHAYKQERERLVKRIENAQKRLEKHEKTYPHWTDIVKTICLAICEHEHLRLKEDKEFYTFGMRAECPCAFYDDKGELKAYMVFTMNWGDNTLQYDTGEKTFETSRTSIAGLNGFDNETKPLPNTIDEICKTCLYGKHDK